MEIRKISYIIILLMLLPGCATIDFFQSNYQLSDKAKKEISEYFDKLNNGGFLIHKYTYSLVEDGDCDPPGIMQITPEQHIKIPINYARYIYYYYYDDREIIFTCSFAHEMGHGESGRLDAPPEVHYTCDTYTIHRILDRHTNYGAREYYNTLDVLEKYWYARKGALGNAANIGWNVFNVFGIFMGYGGVVGDWYATDILQRKYLLVKDYPDANKTLFKRSDINVNEINGVNGGVNGDVP